MRYIKKILKLLIKNGKKTLAVESVNTTLEKLKKKLPPSRLNSIFKPLEPAVKIFRRKVSGKLYQVPAIIKEERAVFQISKWVTDGILLEKKGISLSAKLGKVLFDMSKTRGAVLKLRQQFLILIKENRAYMRFIRKKRKKKIYKMYKQNFTGRIVKQETREEKNQTRITTKTLLRSGIQPDSKEFKKKLKESLDARKHDWKLTVKEKSNNYFKNSGFKYRNQAKVYEKRTNVLGYKNYIDKDKKITFLNNNNNKSTTIRKEKIYENIKAKNKK